jgi:hypothetical protein
MRIHFFKSSYLLYYNIKYLYIFVDCSKVDFVLFETAGTLRDALIRDWILLSQDQKNELRQYLFQFIMRDGNMAPFVRERILQVMNIM